MWHHRQCTSNSTVLQMYYKISHILKSINIECFSHPSKVGQRRQMQSIKLYYHYIKGIWIVSNENVYSSHIFLFRLFLESNPIPAKKALQLMGKIGYCSLGIYSESMYWYSFPLCIVLFRSGYPAALVRDVRRACAKFDWGTHYRESHLDLHCLTHVKNDS